MSDEAYMKRAIRLSRRGFPAPNPHVGCVLVRDGKIVGEGYHHHAGGPHAEAAALQDAGPKAKGATAFVTLEPCNHFGRTPPCSQALIAAGVVHVVVAVDDPNPRAQGGAETLRAAGLTVDTGLLANEAENANLAWLTATRRKRPFVVGKAAISLDGRIALSSGESKWITGEASRRAGHRLRAECGAVLVGRKTVEADDPALTARIPGVVNQPVRIVLDRYASLPKSHKIFADPGTAIRVVEPNRSNGDLEVSLTEDGFDLGDLLSRLGDRGLTGLLVEGGGRTLGSFLRQGFIDRLHLFVAPKVLGGGPSWIEGWDLHRLAEAPSLKPVCTVRRGDDWELILEKTPS